MQQAEEMEMGSRGKKGNTDSGEKEMANTDKGLPGLRQYKNQDGLDDSSPESGRLQLTFYYAPSHPKSTLAVPRRQGQDDKTKQGDEREGGGHGLHHNRRGDEQASGHHWAHQRRWQ